MAADFARDRDFLGRPVRARIARLSLRARRCSHKVSEVVVAVAARRHAELAVGGVAHVDAADVARIVSDFETAEPVAFGHEDPEPRRVIVQGEQFDALLASVAVARSGRKFSITASGASAACGGSADMGAPFVERNFQRLLVHLAVVVDDRERHATFEIGEGQAGALLGRIAVAILDRAAGGAVAPADDPRSACRAGASTTPPSCTRPRLRRRIDDAIFGAAAPERGSLELFRRIRHDLLSAVRTLAKHARRRALRATPPCGKWRGRGTARPRACSALRA